jgi:hypothetical protein
MSPLTVQLPDHLIAALKTLNTPPQDIIIQALETYLQTHPTPERVASQIPPGSRTWELCGKYDLAPSNSPTTNSTTNYAEQIDTVLYDRLTES